MLAIPLYIFLFLYLFAFTIFIVIALIDTYHIISAGAFTFVSLTMTTAVFTLGIGVFLTTWYLLSEAGINWNHTITLLNFDWISGITSSSPF